MLRCLDWVMSAGVTAACFADIGHWVTGVDKDSYKVEKVRGGEAPFFELGLPESVRKAVDSGRLTATTSTNDALRDADIALLCVGTPSERNGNLGLDQLRRVVEEIREFLTENAKPLIVAVRSTVFPGTCEEVVDLHERTSKTFRWFRTRSFFAKARRCVTLSSPRLSLWVARIPRPSSAWVTFMRHFISSRRSVSLGASGDDQIRLQCIPRRQSLFWE